MTERKGKTNRILHITTSRHVSNVLPPTPHSIIYLASFFFKKKKGKENRETDTREDLIIATKRRWQNPPIIGFPNRVLNNGKLSITLVPCFAPSHRRADVTFCLPQKSKPKFFSSSNFGLLSGVQWRRSMDFNSFEFLHSDRVGKKDVIILANNLIRCNLTR